MSDSTVVLIPGLMCDRRFWRGPAAAIDLTRSVVVPELHDHDSLSMMADAILADIDGPLDVVGHSMGGRVALEIWARAPRRVRSLALLDTGVHPVASDEPERRQVLVDLARAEGMGAVADRWIPMMIHPDRHTDRVLVDEIRAMVTGYRVDQFVGQVGALLGRRDAEPILSTISCPTLVACGSHDGWSPPDQHRRIAAAIADARLEIVDSSGHMVAMERPDETTALIADWVTRP